MRYRSIYLGAELGGAGNRESPQLLPNPKYVNITADYTFSTSLINHISNYPLRQKPPLQQSTQPFTTITKIHSAFFHLY